MEQSITQFEQALLLSYKSPAHERSIVKQVPIAELAAVRSIFNKIGVPVRIRYRGPRHDGMRLTTLKRHARGFTVYKK